MSYSFYRPFLFCEGLNNCCGILFQVLKFQNPIIFANFVNGYSITFTICANFSQSRPHPSLRHLKRHILIMGRMYSAKLTCYKLHIQLQHIIGISIFFYNFSSHDVSLPFLSQISNTFSCKFLLRQVCGHPREGRKRN